MSMSKPPGSPTPPRALTMPPGPKHQHGPGADKAKGDRKTLVVGPEITLSGEIASCEKLVVEGEVRCSLENCRSLEIVRGGSFRGKAKIATAEVAGLFEGELDVEGCLFLRATGQITGAIRYREIEIERGGKIAGTLEVANEADADRRGKTGQSEKASHVVA